MLLRLMAIALLAVYLAQIGIVSAVGLSALPLAILMGMIYGNLSSPEFSPGDTEILRFSQQKLLRFGIVLYGFSLNFQEVFQIGWQAVVTALTVIVTVITLGIAIGQRVFKQPLQLVVLISVGSAVCGAAAVMAMEAVTKAKERDVTVAVATVVIFGTLAMFCYPVIYALVDIEPSVFGIYIGSTVHEVAQAIAAGQAIDEQATQNAVLVKLIRVMLLAPVVVVLGLFMFRERKRDPSAKWCPVALPWFILWFILAAVLNTMIAITPTILAVLHYTSQFALAMAMVSLGMKTHWSTVLQAGPVPLLLSLTLFCLLLAGGYGLNLLLYG